MVQLTTYLTPDAVHLDVDAANKEAVIAAVGAALAIGATPPGATEIAERLLARERLASTGVGSGIAIPHASTDAVDDVRLGLFRTREPVPFDAVDGAPVQLVIAVLAPRTAQALHLKLLARIARLVHRADIRDGLLQADDAEGAWALLAREEGVA
jgi:PTS system nitrogen regulatory IIA component